MRRYLLGVLEGAAVDQKDGDAERGTRPTRRHLAVLNFKLLMPNGDKANEIRWRHGWEIVGPRRSEPLLRQLVTHRGIAGSALDRPQGQASNDETLPEEHQQHRGNRGDH